MSPQNPTKLEQLFAQSLSYNAEDKRQFHSEGKKALRLLAKALNLTAGSFEIRSNMGGIAVSGEVILHSDEIYIQISQSPFMRGNDILYRRCNGRKDYVGDRNHFAPIGELADYPSFAAKVKRHLSLTF